MLSTTKNSIKKVCSIVTAVWSVLVGILFIVQAWRIFGIGTHPYTVENISKKFAEIAFFVYAWLALVIADLVLGMLFPAEQEKAKAFFLSNATTLNRLKRRMPQQTEADLQIWQDIYAWKVRNVLSWCVSLVVGALCLSVAIAYVVGGFAPIAQTGFFAEHSSAEFILRSLPWMFGALGAGVFAVYFNAYAQNKQIVLMKTVMANAIKRGEKPKPKQKQDWFAFTQSAWFLPVVRGVVGAVAITLIIVGICTGGMGAVFSNAITICTQCIGLG